MANGWRANGITPSFTREEEDSVDTAARRLAASFGYGAAWAPQVVHPSQASFESGDVANAEILNVAHRGGVVEQAARRCGGTNIHVRRQHGWSIHGGIVALPCSTPDPGGQGALSFANLESRELDSLMAYALEDINAWYRVEPKLVAYSSLTHVMAARDAMSRVMYRLSATFIDVRAKQLCMRAAAYREETRRAEWDLRGWLVSAANKFNAARPYRAVPMGASQGNGLRATSWWNEKEYRSRLSKVNRKLIGTAGLPANDITSRDARSSAKDHRPSRPDPRTDRADLLAA